MRTILLATLATLAASTLAPTADACGPYMMSPRVFIIASSGDRSFAIERSDATADARFTPVAPLTYDATAIAEQPALTAPFALTLLGADGSHRAIKTAKQVLVKDSWMIGHGKQLAALELPGHARFQIAVAGNHTDLGWTPVETTSTATGMVSQITDAISAESIYDATISDYRTTLKSKDATVIGVYVGLPMGVLAADGQTHLVVDDAGIAHAYLIY